MKGFRLNECVDASLEDMVIITGIFRSGTTMLGRVVGSLKGVEYAYEPPLLYYAQAWALKGEHGKMDLLDWLKVYLYYDHFLNLQLGRYNFRATDSGSCVLRYKPYEEVVQRWNTLESPRQAAFEKGRGNARFAVKFCSFYRVLRLLVAEYPGIQVLDLNRDLRRVMSSMMAKKWFYEDKLRDDGAVMWPFYGRQGGLKVPYLVRESDMDQWCGWNDATRTAYMCCRFAEEKIAFRQEMQGLETHEKTYLEVSYEAILNDAKGAVERIRNFIGLERGAMTISLTEGISLTAAAYSHEQVLSECEEGIREEFEDLNRQLGYGA